MILNDLFESKMSDLDIQYQDYKKLNPGAFHSRYKMTPDEWASRHWSLIKSSQTVHEGATVAYVVSYFDTKTGDRGESTVSALTQQDAKDQIVDLMHERGYDVVVTGVRSAQGVAEADETSWTANSAQFRKEEDMSWTVEVTLEPRADINQGRGRQVKTMTVTGQSRDAVKKKLADYYRKNGWAVTGIKFVGDLEEAEGDTYRIIRTNGHGVKDVFGAGYSLEQAKGELAKCLAHPLHTKHGHKFEIVKHSKQGVAEAEDKVRQVNDAEYYHLKLLAKEAGITLTGMGADKVTGDLHWQGDTRDGRRVSGTVKKVIDDNGEYIQGVAEGSQTFGKPEPYWVCVNGKKWKRFETYAHARAVHDRLEKKLRDEGSDKKVSLLADDQLDEKQDACYHKVKSRYKVWPSAYASGALVQCRKKGAANWGNKSKK